MSDTSSNSNKPQVPKKILISSIKEKQKVKTENSSDDDANQYNYPRDIFRKKSNSSKLSTQETQSEVVGMISVEEKGVVSKVEYENNIYDNEDIMENAEYFNSRNNYSNLSEMTSKMVINEEDKKEYYYNKLVPPPKLPPKSVINSINRQGSLRKKSSNNEDIYEYTYCQVFSGDDKNQVTINSNEESKIQRKLFKKSVNEENEVENDYYKRSKILSINKINNNSLSVLSLEELIDKSFISTQDLDNLKDSVKFESQVYANSSNLKCVDCKVLKPNWISCRFMVTLCNQCAYIHNKFGHELNEYYLIEIKELFNGKASDLTKICILKLLFEIGNEKFNLLLEQSSQKEVKDGETLDNDDSSYNRECMIQEKYFNNKPFFDDYELNLQLFTNIQGNFLFLSIYKFL